MAEPVRIGIVGLGRAGWGMQCQELKPRGDKFKVVAACDIQPQRRQRVADAFGCKTYEDIGGLLADPEVELVSIATRSCDHFSHAAAALKSGKHVQVEKPMTCTYAQAARLQALAAKSKGRLFVRHNRRYEPGFNHIREIIASGILGTVYEIKLRRVHYARRDDWQTIQKYGGGQLLNWAPHIVDHALQFLDYDVAGQWSSLKRIAAVGDAEDFLKIVLTGTRGLVVDLEISGGSALGEPEYLVWGTRGALTTVGSDLKLRYLDPKVKLSKRRANPGDPQDSFGSPDRLPWIEKTLSVQPRRKADMTTIWDDIHATIRKGAKFPISLDQAVAVMKVISASRKGTKF